MNENRIMKPIEIVLRRGGGFVEERELWKGESKIHYKHICKYHNVSTTTPSPYNYYTLRNCFKKIQPSHQLKIIVIIILN
jgi:hypothetical protein